MTNENPAHAELLGHIFETAAAEVDANVPVLERNGAQVTPASTFHSDFKTLKTIAEENADADRNTVIEKMVTAMEEKSSERADIAARRAARGRHTDISDQARHVSEIFIQVLKNIDTIIEEAAESENPTVEALLEAGGREWQNYGKHRIYLDSEIAYELAGGSIDYYKSGNIWHASLPAYEEEHGRLSNRRAALKVFYDLDRDELQVQGVDPTVCEVMKSQLLAWLESKTK